MALETRIFLKNFNGDLLKEQLAGSVLPFAGVVNFYGFERISLFVGAPRTEIYRISYREIDGVVTEDFAAPGELRMEFSFVLTAAEDTGLDTLLTAHDATQRTAEQTRRLQDETDLDTLILQHPNVDGMNNVQLRNYVQLLARVTLRELRNPPI